MVATLAQDTANRLYGAYCTKITVTAANEGMYQDYAVVAGQDYFLSGLIKSDGTNIAQFRVYDVENAGSLVTITTTANAWTNLTTAFEVAAGCSTIRVFAESGSAAAYDIFCQQVVVYSNLWDDPGMETGTAPTQLGTPTTFAQSAVQAHTGTNSWRVVADAATEGLYQWPTVTSGKFYYISIWYYLVSGNVQFHCSGSLNYRGPALAVTGSWLRVSLVTRALSTGAANIIMRSTGGAAEWYTDDVCVIELDPITLTVTPATEANSRESMAGTQWGTADTMRVDGTDTLTFPTSGNIRAAEGAVMFWNRARHATAWADEVLFDAGGASPNAFSIRRVATTNVLHVYYGDQNDASTATIADTSDHHVTLTWKDGICYLYIDAVAAAGFALTGAATPTLNANAYIGSTVAGTLQADAATLGLATSLKALSAGKITQLYNRDRAWILGDL